LEVAKKRNERRGSGRGEDLPFLPFPLPLYPYFLLRLLRRLVMVRFDQLTILRTLKILIVFSGHFLIICFTRNNFEYILNNFECVLNLIKLL